MNHIKRLQADNEAMRNKLEAVSTELQSFREHLQLPKFRNPSDYERLDWIATADVEAWIERIRRATI